MLLLLAGADGATLRVDFDGLEEGSEAGETQADYESFRGPGSNGNAELDVTVTYIDALMAEDVTVRLIAQRWKKRSAITGGDETAISLGNLLKDFAGPRSGKSALLSLALPPGVHEIAVYHHETNRTAGEFALVVVTDADGPRDPVELVSGYGSTEASPPLVFTTTIRSDGINEVTFVYDNTDTTTSNAFPINGFVLTTEAIPHAVDPNPTNGVIGVGPETVLSWECAGGVCNSFNLYLDTDSELGSPDVIMGLTEPFHNAGLLEVATKYYWRIDTVHDSGTTEGSVWNFTTAGLAQNPWPADGASAIRTDIELVWTGDSLAESYDVYIDTADATTHVARVTEPNLVVSLEFGTTYYWRVVELDGEGRAIAEGNVWSFATMRNPLVIRLNDSQPIIDRTFDGVGNNINGPSLIRIPDWIASADRADPSAVYYLYFAHHQGTNIRMAWSVDIEGPYTMYNPQHGVLELGIGVGSLSVSGHVASPDIHVDDENQRIVMYFHGGTVKWDGVGRGQSTCVATSPFGLDFNQGVEETIVGDFYYRVFEYGGQLYAIAKEGWTWKALDANNPWNPEGVDLTSRYLWERSATNAFAGLGKTVRHNALVVVGDTLHVFYSCYPDMPERILHSMIDLREDWNNWVASEPDEILEPELDWEGADLPLEMSASGSATNVRQLRDPAIFLDADGERYMLYSGRGEEAIGLARFISKCYIPLAGDFTDNCDVDTEDLALLCEYWLTEYDLGDFAELSQNWLVNTTDEISAK